MEFTKEQISELMCKHAERENGLHDIFEIMLESMMTAERTEFLHGMSDGNKGNGYRLGHTYGQGRKLEFRIPRDRYGNFHPQILAVLKNQEEECDRLAGALYSKGLTQSQVGDIFDEIYGEHYSKSSISRMIQYMRDEVAAWLDRSLESYYPIVFIDCVFIKVRRARCCSSEAFYVIMGVREDKTREVLGIYNNPGESATGWADVLWRIRERGVDRIGLVVADGLKGLDTAVGDPFPNVPLQRCTTHLKRGLMDKVKHGDKLALAEDMRDIFRTGERSYTRDMAWSRWQDFCDRWGATYRSFRTMRDNLYYMDYFTYLDYDYRIQSMIYTTNWIERLQKDFRRVTKMRGAMPNDESVLTLMGKTAMDKNSYGRQLPRIDMDKTLFPD